MQSSISATPSTSFPASVARSLSSSSGISTIHLPRPLLLPYEISDQFPTARPPLRSLEVQATSRGNNRTAIRGSVCKGREGFGEPLKASVLQNSPFRTALSNTCNASQVSSRVAVHFLEKQQKVYVNAAYRKIPMDTSGAYRLIDEETGDSFIIWGDADCPSPSKEAVTWKPKENSGQGEQKILSGSLGNFGRLKVPKIRELMKNSLLVGTTNSHSSVKASASVALLDESYAVDSDTYFAREEALLELPLDGNTNGIPLASNVRRKTVTSRDTLGKDVGVADAHPSPRRSNTPLKRWENTDSARTADAFRKKHQRKLPCDSGFFSRRSFNDLGYSNYMIESLQKQSIVRPSNIQAIAFSPVLEGQSCIIADQSGSGKTLAYLAPLVQRLREEELSGIGNASPKSPRVVILAPTAELAYQVLQICRSLAKCGVPFRSVVITGGFRQKTQLDSLQQELDILVATPGRFMFLFKEGYIQLNNLKCVVLDEVDILFGDEDFASVLQSFTRSAPMTTQYLFITATLPVEIYHNLIETFPDCKVVMGPGIHRTSSRLEEVLFDCSGVEGEEKNPDTAFLNKKTALLKIVEEIPVPKTIIFCNKIETCRKVENALRRFDRQEIRLKVLPFHAALAQEVRLSNMEVFLKSEPNESMFLVCTDRASRGIDFANVDHVVLFDFPRDPSEYVRRVGRTARGAAGVGKAFVFVVGKQVSLAKRIIERNRKGHPVHDIPQAYELQNSVL